jgi:hypothetical protein
MPVLGGSGERRQRRVAGSGAGEQQHVGLWSMAVGPGHRWHTLGDGSRLLWLVRLCIDTGSWKSTGGSMTHQVRLRVAGVARNRYSVPGRLWFNPDKGYHASGKAFDRRMSPG